MINKEIKKIRKISAIPDTHGKGVDIFVQLIQKCNALDDHVVHSVDIELDLGPGVAVAQTELCNTRCLCGES